MSHQPCSLVDGIAGLPVGSCERLRYVTCTLPAPQLVQTTRSGILSHSMTCGAKFKRDGRGGRRQQCQNPDQKCPSVVPIQVPIPTLQLEVSPLAVILQFQTGNCLFDTRQMSTNVLLLYQDWHVCQHFDRNTHGREGRSAKVIPEGPEPLRHDR
jgi:hypothetical protein